jgi:hypothetical protein
VLTPDSRLDFIDTGAFGSCESLTSICIPRAVEYLRTGCFKRCHSIVNMTFEANSRLRGIGFSVFEGCLSLKSICLPSSVQEIESSAFVDTGISTISFEGDSSYFRFSGPHLLTFDGTRFVRSFGNDIDVEIDQSVQQLCGYCFHGCKLLQLIRFESVNSLSEIGASAFDGCSSLRSIVIPRSVEFLGSACFSECTSLVSVTFESGITLQAIPDYAFSFCSSLLSIVIPRSVESLGAWCFHSCRSLRELTIEPGSHLTCVESTAFLACISLKSFDLPREFKPNSELLMKLASASRGQLDCRFHWSPSIRVPATSAAPLPKFPDCQSKGEMSIRVKPRWFSTPGQKVLHTLFSDSECECLEDEFESGYRQFLSMIDSSFP